MELWVGLQCVIVAFLEHTHLLLNNFSGYGEVNCSQSQYHKIFNETRQINLTTKNRKSNLPITTQALCCKSLFPDHKIIECICFQYEKLYHVTSQNI